MRRINENRNLITKRSKPEEFSVTFQFVETICKQD